MKSIDIHMSFLLVGNQDELDVEFKELVEQAVSARSRSYSPYSGYGVGAAAKLSNGEIVTGNNQENAAYPSGLCAERTCTFFAKSQYPSESIQKMAVVASPSGATELEAVTPCGSCRQVLLEYEILQGSPISLVLSWQNGTFLIVNSVKDLLPIPFSTLNLEGKTANR